MMYDASNLNGIKIGLNSYALLTRTTVETVRTWKSLYLCIELMNYSQMEEDYTEPYIMNGDSTEEPSFKLVFEI